MAYWLFKSEPEEYDFERLKRDGWTAWSGVRNYQARNFMLKMKPGDLGFFYHSNTTVPAIVGIARVVSEPYPDYTARDPLSPYYDPRATDEQPIWQMVDIAYDRELPRVVTLSELREQKRLAKMVLLQRGSRLSVQPVTNRQWAAIMALSERPPPA